MRARRAKPNSPAAERWLDWWHETPVPIRQRDWALVEERYREAFRAFANDKRRRRRRRAA